MEGPARGDLQKSSEQGRVLWPFTEVLAKLITNFSGGAVT